MPVPAVRKISDTIVDFGEPLLCRLDAGQPCELVRARFELVIRVWNAYVMAMPRWGQPRVLAELQQRLRDADMPLAMDEAVRLLSLRRREGFATDARAVGSWSIALQGGQWRLRCEARTPDASVLNVASTLLR